MNLGTTVHLTLALPLWGALALVFAYLMIGLGIVGIAELDKRLDIFTVILLWPLLGLVGAIALFLKVVGR